MTQGFLLQRDFGGDGLKFSKNPTPCHLAVITVVGSFAFSETLDPNKKTSQSRSVLGRKFFEQPSPEGLLSRVTLLSLQGTGYCQLFQVDKRAHTSGLGNCCRNIPITLKIPVPRVRPGQ